MARTYWRNSDGLKVKFGSDTKPYPEATAKRDDDAVEKTIVVDFDYTALPTKNANDTGSAKIKAGSVITRAYLLVDSAWTGGTDLTIGLRRADGSTEIDNDGIVSATAGAQANLTAGKVVFADGALIPGRFVKTDDAGAAADPLLPAPVSIGANDGFIHAAANGTFTGGSARLVVKFIEPYTAVTR